MKRNKATQLKEDMNGNVENIGQSPKKMKADNRKEIASRMKTASSEVSKYHTNRARGGEQSLDPLHKAVILYESAADLAESSWDGKDMLEIVKKMDADLAILRTEYRTHTAMAQGLQALFMAGSVVEDALRGNEEMSVELVWEALDLYKQAALVSGDVEVEAHARGKTGLIYLNILKMEEIAKAYLSNAMDLAKTLFMEHSVNLYTFSWYPEVAQAWKDLQDKVIRREEDDWTREKEPLLQDKEVKRSLKLLESKEIVDVVEFAEFLFEYFEPDHLKEKVTYEVFKKEAESKGIMNDVKKMLLKLIIHWHPDKVSKETEENKKWFIICEEITKKLTAKYSLYGC